VKALPAFVYLSAVLQQYADCGHLLRSGNDDSEPAAIFGRFLAGLIKSGKVLVFDVHTLKLPKDGEWEDVIEYLQHYSTDSRYPLNVGIAAGLDYCVDAHNLSLELVSTGCLPRLTYKSPVRKGKTASKAIPKTPCVSIYKPDKPSGWEEKKVPLTKEFITLQLASGRHQSLRKKGNPLESLKKPEDQLVYAPRELNEYCGAVQPKDWSHTVGSERIYLAGKFNAVGDPALLLDDKLVGVGPRNHPVGSKLALRYEGWRQRLKAMYSAGPFAGKTHEELSDLLAKQLELETSPFSKGKKAKLISGKTIRRETSAEETYAGNPPPKKKPR
jgi:uncharacterized protein YggU (UPF0235/DUF167 family)